MMDHDEAAHTEPAPLPLEGRVWGWSGGLGEMSNAWRQLEGVWWRALP